LEQFKRCREGSEDLEDDPRSGNPPNAQNPDTVEKVCEMMA
jgi:hypothetical protein